MLDTVFILERFYKRFNSFKRLSYMLDGVSIGDSCKTFTARAKCVAGDDCTLVVIEELFAELITAHSKFLDVREYIERAFRLKGVDTEALE